MKHCTKCGTEKQEKDFYSKGKTLQSYCKACFNAYCVKRWTQIKVETVEDFGGKCKDCNNTYPYQVFEFHHLDPKEKDYDWSKIRLMSPAKRKSELSKCVMLCANCHRIRHIALSN